MNVDYRWVLIGLLVVLLLISAGIGYLLVKRNRHLTRELARTRLNPLGLDDFDEQPLPEENMDLKTVLFFGDSRAAAWPDPDMDDRFVFVNRGIDGQSSAQTAQRFLTHASSVQPDIIVVQVCVNDLWRIPVFPQEKETIIQVCQDNLGQIVNESRELGATVLLTTIFPVQDPPLTQRMYWSSDVHEGIETVNTFINELAAEDVVVMDAYELLVDENGRLQNQYASDYLHLNKAGYQKLNELLAELLVSISP